MVTGDGAQYGRSWITKGHVLGRKRSDADLYLYDLRAEEIRDLIAQLESNRLEAEANSSRWMESPTTGRFAVRLFGRGCGGSRTPQMSLITKSSSH
jgi:hypothetical protein